MGNCKAQEKRLLKCPLAETWNLTHHSYNFIKINHKISFYQEQIFTKNKILEKHYWHQYTDAAAVKTIWHYYTTL